MSDRRTDRNPRMGSTLLALFLLGFGYLLGAAGQPSQPAAAGVRESPPRQAFKSGGARSEVVLQEIAATLKRIESRVDTIEKVATSQAGQ